MKRLKAMSIKDLQEYCKNVECEVHLKPTGYNPLLDGYQPAIFSMTPLRKLNPHTTVYVETD